MTAKRTPEEEAGYLTALCRETLARGADIYWPEFHDRLLIMLREQAEVSREERAAEQERLMTLYRDVKAQVAAAERRGEERVRDILRHATLWSSRYDRPDVLLTHATNVVRGSHVSLWWALTGEGEPPQEQR